MNVLIVDDEYIAIQGLQMGINWREFGIDAVFTAMNASQARKVLSTHTIDILLSDIEMHGENGLELISWINERFPKMKKILLTCHSEFLYAQKAIELGVLQYLIKPISFGDLGTVLEKAVSEALLEKETITSNQLGGGQSNNNQSAMIQIFWRELVLREFKHTRADLSLVIKERGLPLDIDMRVLPIYFSIRKWNGDLEKDERRRIKQLLMKSASELIVGKKSGAVVEIYDHDFVVFLYRGSNISDNSEINCEAFIENSRVYFCCELCCYLGISTDIIGVNGMIDALKMKDSQNIKHACKVFRYEEQIARKASSLPPDFSKWFTMLSHGAGKHAEQDIVSYLQEEVAHNRLCADDLKLFQQDYAQHLYACLMEQGIKANVLFSDSEAMQRFEQARTSVDNMIEWVQYTLQRTEPYTRHYSKHESLINKVKRFIHSHIGEELTREEVAADVNLNADYLSRIFKKETGYTIAEYISRIRIDQAQLLLRNTNLNVGEIASRVGYINAAHFSRAFKKQTQMNPGTYRLRRISL